MPGTTQPEASIATEAGATFEVWTTVADRDLVVCAPAPGWTEFEALVRACGFLGDDARLTGLGSPAGPPPRPAGTTAAPRAFRSRLTSAGNVMWNRCAQSP